MSYGSVFLLQGWEDTFFILLSECFAYENPFALSQICTTAGREFCLPVQEFDLSCLGNYLNSLALSCIGFKLSSKLKKFLKRILSNTRNSTYRIVRKNWDTQRIGTRLKIVKIIILADPKNWIILRKRKNIRNFSDPKNWDGVLGAPK